VIHNPCIIGIYKIIGRKIAHKGTKISFKYFIVEIMHKII